MEITSLMNVWNFIEEQNLSCNNQFDYVCVKLLVSSNVGCQVSWEIIPSIQQAFHNCVRYTDFAHQVVGMFEAIYMSHSVANFLLYLSGELCIFT